MVAQTDIYAIPVAILRYGFKALTGRELSADGPRTVSTFSLSFIDGEVLSGGTGEALRDRPTFKLRGAPPTGGASLGA